MIPQLEKLEELRKELIQTIKQLAEENEYNHPFCNVKMLRFRKLFQFNFKGVSFEYGLIDSNENHYNLESMNTDDLVEIVKLCQNPVVPFILDQFIPGKLYTRSAIEFSVQTIDDIIDLEDIGDADQAKEYEDYKLTGFVLRSYEARKMVVFVFQEIRSEPMYRCVFNTEIREK